MLRLGALHLAADRRGSRPGPQARGPEGSFPARPPTHIIGQDLTFGNDRHRAAWRFMDGLGLQCGEPSDSLHGASGAVSRTPGWTEFGRRQQRRRPTTACAGRCAAAWPCPPAGHCRRWLRARVWCAGAVRAGAALGREAGGLPAPNPGQRLAIVCDVMRVFAFTSNFSCAHTGSLLPRWLAQGLRLLGFNCALAAVLLATGRVDGVDVALSPPPAAPACAPAAAGAPRGCAVRPG
jgi:hypothetical protein